MAVGLKKLLPEDSISNGSFVRNILPLSVFKSVAAYERVRSDREGRNFSIIVYQNTSSDRSLNIELMNLVFRITRSVDSIGANDRGELLILLLDTGYAGAVTLTEKIARKLGYSLAETVLNIYTYPKDWISNDFDSEPYTNLNIDAERSVSEHIESFFVLNVPVWKRVLDILGAALLIVLTSPFSLLTVIYLKMVSPGPVFFKQTRIGFKGKPFQFYKFRTMKCSNDTGIHGSHSQNFIKSGEVPMQKLDCHDPRIIRGGRVLRSSCIDELPQFWNVLKGDMSLVGPRPCIPYEAAEYLRWHTHRFDTMPGLTGLWQVSGKSKLSFKQMVRLDISYCENLSLWTDLLIILRTPFAIIKIVVESFFENVDPDKVDTPMCPDEND